VVNKGNKKAGFEQALHELESLVETMEKGDMELEEALKSFERGVFLARQCGDILSKAEQRVQILSGKKSDAKLIEFDSDT
jgi:exodeoxyribonuclease VII small subunit